MQSPQSCALSAADLKANASLTFQQFDQEGSIPSSARQLADRGCFEAAAAATQHYLVNGPLATDRQQRILAFHLGQQLASAGREKEAGLVIAGTRHPPVEGAPLAPLRWNDFVTGVWAFLTKDRAGLRRSIEATKAGEGQGNALNANLLEGLDRCFTKPYREATAAPCRILPDDAR